MDDYIAHFGVKGMKWGKRKKRQTSSSSSKSIPETKIIMKDGKTYQLKKVKDQDAYYISDMSNKGEKTDRFGFMTAKQVADYERSEKVKKTISKLGSTKIGQAIKKYADKAKSFISDVIKK